MSRQTTAFVLIGTVLLTGLALTLWLRGRTPDPPDPPESAQADRDTPAHVEGASSSTTRPRAPGAGRTGGGDRDGDGPDSAGARSGATVDVIGGSGTQGSAGDEDEDGDDPGSPAQGSLAEIGAAMGIDTSMDDQWTLEDEAAQWFAPMEEAFEAARPLTPEKYKEILGEHGDTRTQVLQRSAEIADEIGSDRGIEFIEAYNELVEGYRDEAYGTP